MAENNTSGFSGTFTALQRLDENLLKLSGVSRKHGGRLDNSPRLYIAPITGYIVALFPARSPLKHAPLFIYKANTTTPPRCMRLPFVCVRELAACVYYLFVSMYSLYVSDVCVDVYVCVYQIFICLSICFCFVCHCFHARADIETSCASGPSAIEDLVVELESSGESTDVQFPRCAMVLINTGTTICSRAVLHRVARSPDE